MEIDITYFDNGFVALITSMLITIYNRIHLKTICTLAVWHFFYKHLNYRNAKVIFHEFFIINKK